MARKSSSFETLMKSSEQGLSKTSKNAIDNLPVERFEQGTYILVPQKHFNVDVTVNGMRRVSSRFAVVNLKDKYCRTMKINDLTGSLSVVGELPDLKTEKRKNDDGIEVTRIVRGELSGKGVRSCIKGQVPLITEGETAKVVTPCMLKVIGYATGANVSYVEQANNPGVWDVELNDDGEVVFNKASLIQFEVDRNIKDEDVQKAISLIEDDDQMNDLYVAL